MCGIVDETQRAAVLEKRGMEGGHQQGKARTDSFERVYSLQSRGRPFLTLAEPTLRVGLCDFD